MRPVFADIILRTQYYNRPVRTGAFVAGALRFKRKKPAEVNGAVKWNAGKHKQRQKHSHDFCEFSFQNNVSFHNASVLPKGIFYQKYDIIKKRKSQQVCNAVLEWYIAGSLTNGQSDMICQNIQNVKMDDIRPAYIFDNTLQSRSVAELRGCKFLFLFL